MTPADIERLILLAPIEPAATGNGLAMRAELFRMAAERDFIVQTVVVPVAGHLPRGADRAPGAVIVPAHRDRARSVAMALVGDPVWRDRLARAGSLPSLARAGSLGLADAVVGATGGSGQAAVHVMRSYLAPLGKAVAERLEARWVTLDLDEDDTELADPEDAAAYGRMLSVFAPLFDGLSAASAGEARAIGERHGVAVTHIPNAVAQVPKRARTNDRGEASLLFVGNLTYAPNVDAATELVGAVVPRLQRRVRLTLVGPHDVRVAHLAGPHVDVAGFVPDLGPVYASADVVVAPLRRGAGTRIKLLEAFAHGIPVVASRAAAAGLEVSDGEHLLLADGPEKTAIAVDALLADHSLAENLVRQAGRLFRARYSTDVVIPMIRDFFGRASRSA